MKEEVFSVITGTGSFIPDRKVCNDEFESSVFYDQHKKQIDKPSAEIIEKFHEITNISERRYVDDTMVTSDIATYAAKEALDSSGTDPESLDYIILAHNFGDVKKDGYSSDLVPQLAARVKHKLGIKNPQTIAVDLLFGCPGWLQAVIHSDSLIKAGAAKKVLVIGAETLSRISDPYDRDSMIYADGSGAAILEASESEEKTGILSFKGRSDTLTNAFLLKMGGSFSPSANGKQFLKMSGHKVYQYALSTVPEVVKDSLDEAGCTLKDVKKILIHQANEKMDQAILERIFKLYGEKEIPEDIMPMTISWLGNSSVATLPTMLDLILKEKMKPHRISSGDVIVFASVGAGMNINSMVYKVG